jgi:AcrR family transcriptional regulator
MKKREFLFRSPQRVAEAKKYLLDIAVKEFIKRGYDRTSMRDLADAFALSKSGMYHYIGSKEDILEDIIAPDEMAKHLHEIEHETEELDPKEAIAISISKYVKYVHVNEERYKFVNHVMVNLTNDKRKILKRIAISFQSYLTNIIKKGIENGDFKTESPDFVAYEIIVLCQAWATRKWQFQTRVSVSNYIDLVTRNVFKTLQCETNAVENAKEN